MKLHRCYAQSRGHRTCLKVPLVTSPTGHRFENNSVCLTPNSHLLQKNWTLTSIRSVMEQVRVFRCTLCPTALCLTPLHQYEKPNPGTWTLTTQSSLQHEDKWFQRQFLWDQRTIQWRWHWNQLLQWSLIHSRGKKAHFLPWASPHTFTNQPSGIQPMTDVFINSSCFTAWSWTHCT